VTAQPIRQAQRAFEVDAVVDGKSFRARERLVGDVETKQ